MMMGRTVCLLDPQAAAERDTQMLAARAASGAGPQAGNWPPFAAGGILAGSAGAGSYFPQPVASDSRLDDVLGAGAWLIARTDVPQLAGMRAVALDNAMLAPFRDILANWLDERAAAAVLVRPDRYVFGTGEPETLVAAWHAFALAGEAPPAPSVSQTSTGEDYGNRRHL